MAWSLVAEVEHMVVEMVEKVVVEMGSLVFHGGKEEEESGMEVLLLLKMEVGMKERMMVEFVVKMEVEKRSMGGQRREHHGCVCCHALWKQRRRREKKNEWKREKEWGLYKGVGMNIIMLHTFQGKES